MAHKSREVYLIPYSESVSDLVGALQQILHRLTDRLDRMEGLRGTPKLYHITGARLVKVNDSSEIAASDALDDFVLGTTNQIIVTDNGDGTVTLSLPQSIATTSNVQFGKIIINDANGQVIHSFGGTS